MSNTETTATGGINTPETVETPTATEQEKTFTQSQLDRIVGERLAKEKAKNEAALVEREKELSKRERMFVAREMFSQKQIPLEMLDIITIDSDEQLNQAIEVIEKCLNTRPVPRKAGTHIGGDLTPKSHDIVRDAMGLHERK